MINEAASCVCGKRVHSALINFLSLSAKRQFSLPLLPDCLFWRRGFLWCKNWQRAKSSRKGTCLLRAQSIKNTNRRKHKLWRHICKFHWWVAQLRQHRCAVNWQFVSCVLFPIFWKHPTEDIWWQNHEWFFFFFDHFFSSWLRHLVSLLSFCPADWFKSQLFAVFVHL